MLVLLIDNDTSPVTDVGACVMAMGASVDRTDGAGAMGLATLKNYDIAILNLALDTESCGLVRQIRAGGLDVPLLMLSDRSRSEDKVAAFGLGVDDYVAKPFDIAELSARIQAVVRRNRVPMQNLIRIGPLEINLDTREAAVAGRAVALTCKEYACLELLAVRKGMALTKEAFLTHLYVGMDQPEDKIIDVFICKLRRKLSSAGAADVIATVWGRGYTLREPGTAPEWQSVGVSDVRALAEMAM